MSAKFIKFLAQKNQYLVLLTLLGCIGKTGDLIVTPLDIASFTGADPEISFTIPSNNSSFANLSNANSFTLAGTCSHPGESIRLTGDVDGSPIEVSCAPNSTWNTTVDFSSQSEGSLAISATHQNGSEIWSEAVTRVVTKDTTIAAAITAPVAMTDIDDSNKSDFEVSGTCSDVGSPVEVSSTEMNPNPVDVVCGLGNTWTAELDFTAGTAGTVTVSVVHTDEAGNSNTAVTRDFNLIQNTAPTLATNDALTVTEGDGTIVGTTGVTISSSFLEVTDPEEADSDLIFTVSRIPALGQLYNTNTSSVIGLSGTFTMEDIANNYIQYRHTGPELEDNGGTDTDDFEFSFTDGVAAAITGNDFDININDFCQGRTSTSHTAYGSGTLGSPYILCNADQIVSLGNATGATLANHYIQRRNIYMSGSDHPVIGDNSSGDVTTRFSGSYDGRNNRLVHWNHADAATDYIGLFGYVVGDNANSGVIKNLFLEDVEVEGDQYVGGLVARAVGTTIQNIDVIGIVKGNQNFGGVIGYLENSTNTTSSIHASTIIYGGSNGGGIFGAIDSADVENSTWRGGLIKGNSSFASNIGGIAGGILTSNLSNISAAGKIICYSNCGGITGLSFNSTYSAMYFSGNIIAASGNSVGGLLGTSYGSDISFSMTRGGSISGAATQVGGLIGWVNTSLLLNNSYSTMNIEGVNYVGGLLGLHNACSAPCVVENNYHSGNVTASGSWFGAIAGWRNTGITTYNDNFWDSSFGLTDGWDGSSGDVVGEAEARTPAQLRTAATFTGAGWDWWDGSTYPQTNRWVMPQNDTDSIDFPKLTNLYQCYGDAWTLAPDVYGTGTTSDPAIICRPSQLDDYPGGLGTANLDKHIVLGESLDLSAYNPINHFGTSASFIFSGSFNGNSPLGYILDNLNVENGLFHYNKAGSIIRDLTITNASKADTSDRGAIVLREGTSLIKNVHVEGSLNGGNQIGGIVGRGSGGSITNNVIAFSSADVTINATANQIGGLVGMNYGGRIYFSKSSGSVTGGTDDVGGIEGYAATNGLVKYTYSTADVTGDRYVGGFRGSMWSSLFHTYATGDVTGNTDVGGHSGRRGSGSGGSTAYYDTDTTGQSTSGEGATGLTTAQMQDAANFTDWDFDLIWTTNGDTTYPQFQWD